MRLFFYLFAEKKRFAGHTYIIRNRESHLPYRPATASEAEADLHAALRRLEVHAHVYAEYQPAVDASDTSGQHRTHIAVVLRTLVTRPLEHTLHTALHVQVGAETAFGRNIELDVGEARQTCRIEFAPHLFRGDRLAVVGRTDTAADEEGGETRRPCTVSIMTKVLSLYARPPMLSSPS